MTSRHFGRGTTDDREAWGRSGTLTGTAAGGFSAGLGCLSRSGQSGQKSTEGAADATRREALGRPRPLPGQPLVDDQWSGQPELPEGGGYQPSPAVGGGGLAGANRRPAQVLFGESEGMLHREAPQVPAPHLVQVGRQLATDPGQPQGRGLAVAG